MPLLSAAQLWKAGAVFGATGVLFGAFGAHGLQKRGIDAASISSFQRASTYQLLHAGVLLAISLHPRLSKSWSGELFIAGTSLFSGSIYLLVLDRNRFRSLGPVTPIGGLLLVLGWTSLLLDP